MSALEALKIIEVIQAIEAQQFFTYVAISDEVTCPRCLNFDQGSMTRTEARGTFPFLIQYTPTMWLPMTHPNCRCILYFEEEDMPRPDALTDPQLIKKVEDELIQKYQVRSVVADDPVNRDLLSQFKDLPREVQIKVIRQEAMRNTKNLDPQNLMDDEDTWDLVALGVLDSLKKRNSARTKILDRLRGET